MNSPASKLHTGINTDFFTILKPDQESLLRNPNYSSYTLNQDNDIISKPINKSRNAQNRELR